MNLSKKAAPLALAMALTGSLATPTAFAWDPLLATTLPASICQPINDTHAAKVYLSGGQWMFKSGQTGTVYFECPLPVSDRDKDGEKIHMWNYEVHYRDSDGKGTEATVLARPMWRKGGSVSWGPVVLSNNWSQTGYWVGHAMVDRDLEPGAIYSFLVGLSRSSTSVSAGFKGIGFLNVHVSQPG